MAIVILILFGFGFLLIYAGAKGQTLQQVLSQWAKSGRS